MIAGTGVVAPDRPDERDWEKIPVAGEHPDFFVFDDKLLPRVVHQGSTSGCTGAAAATAAAILLRRMGTYYLKTEVSWLWSYHWNRIKSNITGDRGAYPRDTMRALTEVGVIPDRLFSDRFFTVHDLPPKRAKHAVTFHLRGYERVPSMPGASETMKATLGVEKLPLLAATRVYRNAWEHGDRTGTIVAGDRRTDEDLGLHMVCIIGYRRNKDNRCGWDFLFRNSWGTRWGRDGNAWISGDLLEDDWITPDLWTFCRHYW